MNMRYILAMGRRCPACKGLGGRYDVELPRRATVEGFNPIGGFHLLLHLRGGDVCVAQYHACSRCSRTGVEKQRSDSQQAIDEWANDVGFVWPEVARGRQAPAPISGCIDAR